MTAEELIDDLLEYRRMPAGQKARMKRSRKKPKSGAHRVGLKKRRKVAKKPGAKRKAARYRKKMKSRGH